MKDSFLLAWRGAWRGKTAWVLLIAVAAAHWLLPGFVRSDGTATGSFEMHIRLTGGFSVALAYVYSLAVSCGAFAKEREAETLPLALTRPVSALSVALGRYAAIMAVVVCALTLNGALLMAFPPFAGGMPPSRTHHAPSLPPPEVSAAKALEAFLKSDKTPESVKKASRAAVLALLTAKENERYEAVRPGEKTAWPFEADSDMPLTVKVRFSTMYNLKGEVNGVFRYDGLCGTVSNNTQAVLEVPLSAAGAQALSSDGVLEFENTGKSDVLLRPRRDIELLSPGFSFPMNCAMAMAQATALSGLLAAFGLFLSASLSRPVALFSVAVLMAATLIAPDAVSQFPDEFNATAGEKAGLAISRAVAWVTAPFADASPVSDLASSRSVTAGGLVRSLLSGFVVWPLAVLPLTSFILRRKTR